MVAVFSLSGARSLQDFYGNVKMKPGCAINISLPKQTHYTQKYRIVLAELARIS
jgi:hypothetical protein